MSRKPLTAGPGQDCRRDWLRINEVDGDVLLLLGELSTMQAEVAALRRVVVIGSARLHPFRIYQLPSRLRSSSTDADWRKFRVRAGRVILDTDARGIIVTGTDGANDAPYSDELPSVGDFEVPEDTAAYYVWVEVRYASGAWSAAIRHAANPAAAGDDNPNPWSTWPAMDGHRILLGMVDTNTRKATRQTVVRQYQTTDIMLGPAFEVCKDGTTTVHYSISGLAKEALPT